MKFTEISDAPISRPSHLDCLKEVFPLLILSKHYPQ